MRFAKFIISVLVICVVTMALLEYLYRNYSTSAARLFNPYFEKAQTVETIHIGNSHIGVFNGIFPHEVKEIGNLSLGGQDIFRMYTAIKTVIPKSPVLKKIYLGLDYDLIGYNQTKSGQEYIDREYYEFTGELYNNTMTNRLMSQSNFFRSNRDIAYLFKRNKEEKKELNFIPVASAPLAATVDTSTPTASTTATPLPHKTIDPFLCRKRAEEHSLLKFKQKNIPENLEYLDRIVQLCKQHHIELVFFDPPKTECYKSSCSKENVALAKHTIDSFATANKVPYLDFYTDTTFNDDMFVDYDHLNVVGVKILSNKLSFNDYGNN